MGNPSADGLDKSQDRNSKVPFISERSSNEQGEGHKEKTNLNRPVRIEKLKL